MTLNISTWEDFETEIQGEKVSMQIRKLSREAMINIMPTIKKSASTVDSIKGEDGFNGLSSNQYYELAASSLDVQGVGAGIIKDHVRDIKGLTIDNKEIDPAQICGEGCLVNLAVKIINRLVSISQLSEVDVKNSSRPSGGKAETES